MSLNLGSADVNGLVQLLQVATWAFLLLLEFFYAYHTIRHFEKYGFTPHVYSMWKVTTWISSASRVLLLFVVKFMSMKTAGLETYSLDWDTLTRIVGVEVVVRVLMGFGGWERIGRGAVGEVGKNEAGKLVCRDAGAGGGREPLSDSDEEARRQNKKVARTRQEYAGNLGLRLSAVLARQAALQNELHAALEEK